MSESSCGLTARSWAAKSRVKDLLTSANRTCSSTCWAGGVNRLSMTVAPVVLASWTARNALIWLFTVPESVTVLPLEVTRISSSGSSALM